jgi:fructose-bisphosphate aldolase class II
MRLITKRNEVLERLARAGSAHVPLLCPNAETPDEMEGIMLGAQNHARARGRSTVTIGLGFTASYPDHPQLGALCFDGGFPAAALMTAAETWLGWLGGYANRPGLFDEVEVIPFLDHGWSPHAADLQLMQSPWFQEAVGIIMYDASIFDFEENVRRTAAFVQAAGARVVIEACPDKIYERAEMEKRHLRESDLLSQPDAVERFVRSTGVDLIVPNLGTEHRTASAQALEYRHDLARAIAQCVGPIQALHGTSSLGDRLGSVGPDGICKVNYYTAMARAASAAVREIWAATPAGNSLAIAQACGSFVHRTRRTAVAAQVLHVLACLEPTPS